MTTCSVSKQCSYGSQGDQYVRKKQRPDLCLIRRPGRPCVPVVLYMYQHAKTRGEGITAVGSPRLKPSFERNTCYQPSLLLLFVVPLANCIALRFVNLRFTVEDGASLVFDVDLTWFGPNSGVSIKIKKLLFSSFFVGCVFRKNVAKRLFFFARQLYCMCKRRWSSNSISPPRAFANHDKKLRAFCNWCCAALNDSLSHLSDRTVAEDMASALGNERICPFVVSYRYRFCTMKSCAFTLRRWDRTRHNHILFPAVELHIPTFNYI